MTLRISRTLAVARNGEQSVAMRLSRMLTFGKVFWYFDVGTQYDIDVFIFVFLFINNRIFQDVLVFQYFRSFFFFSQKPRRCALILMIQVCP